MPLCFTNFCNPECIFLENGVELFESGAKWSGLLEWNDLQMNWNRGLKSRGISNHPVLGDFRRLSIEFDITILSPIY